MAGWIALVADFASIAGLFLTVAVFVNLRRIKSFYVFRARVPELTQKIGEKASNISKLLGDSENTKPQVELELAEIVVLVRSLRDKSTGDARLHAKRVLKRLEQRAIISANTWDLYVDIQTLLVTFREIQLDLKWEK